MFRSQSRTSKSCFAANASSCQCICESLALMSSDLTCPPWVRLLSWAMHLNNEMKHWRLPTQRPHGWCSGSSGDRGLLTFECSPSLSGYSPARFLNRAQALDRQFERLLIRARAACTALSAGFRSKGARMSHRLWSSSRTRWTQAKWSSHAHSWRQIASHEIWRPPQSRICVRAQ